MERVCTSRWQKSVQVHYTIKTIGSLQIGQVQRRIRAQMRLHLLKETIEVGGDDALPTIGTAGNVEQVAVAVEFCIALNF